MLGNINDHLAQLVECMLGGHVTCNAVVCGSILAVCNYFCEDLQMLRLCSDFAWTLLGLYSDFGP